MKTKKSFIFLILIGLVYSCSNSDEEHNYSGEDGNEEIILVKKINTIWNNRYLYSQTNGTTNINFYADGNSKVEYTYEDSKIVRIDWNVTYSNYSPYNPGSSDSGHSIQRFTYTNDLITYCKYIRLNQIKEYTFEYDAQKRVSKVIYAYNQDSNQNHSILISYISNNQITVNAIGGYYDGQIYNIQLVGGNVIYLGNKNFEYDTKNHIFKNIKGFDQYLFGMLALAQAESPMLSYFDNPFWFLYSNGNNNITSTNITGTTLDITYSYNTENYPISAYEITTNGTVPAETTIEYYE
ncbi:hypothetical protein [Flavobacterium caeni]|uniref:Uncharacterized protein n=1 Tax=Flavobacterium caeni TaxID=490189 RepID=A0A1G5KHN2_9FLAO|nr:hypothetical protein [Flavobacterium caeni]SCY99904.1 hypothetical protein SAMN02927903_03306 [Flavobacterium caeni]